MRQKLNCIFLGSFLYPNGYAATKRKQQFIDYITKYGHFVRVLITLKWAKGHELNNTKGDYKGVPYEVLGTGVRKNILFPFTFIVFVIKSFFKLLKYRKKHSKNIIVTFGINFDTILPLLFAKWLGYKIVFDFVEDFTTIPLEGQSIRYSINLRILRYLPRKFEKYLADGISVISTYIEERQKALDLNVPIYMVPISAENIEYSAKHSKSRNTHFSFLYSGTYGDKEGLDNLFIAFKQINSEYKNTKLYLTGNCPNRIKEKIQTTIGGFDQIEFTGKLDENDYYEVLLNNDVMLMTRTNTSYANAGFPFKLGEYLATGNPVICTDVSDVSSFLKNNESAIIIPPDSSSEIYKAMKMLYESPELANEVGSKGREVCNTFFNPQINSKIFFELLERA